MKDIPNYFKSSAYTLKRISIDKKQKCPVCEKLLLKGDEALCIISSKNTTKCCVCSLNCLNEAESKQTKGKSSINNIPPRKISHKSVACPSCNKKVKRYSYNDSSFQDIYLTCENCGLEFPFYS